MVRVVAAAAVAALGTVGFALPAGAACSADTFAIGHIHVTVTVCLATRPPERGRAAPPTASAVSETLTVRGRSPLTRTVAYTRLPSAETARTIDDVPLEPLGISRTLHLTLAIRGGTPRLEHALLIPGAVVLK